MLLIILILILSCSFFDITIKSVEAFAIAMRRSTNNYVYDHAWNHDHNYNHNHEKKGYNKYDTYLKAGFFDDFINSSFYKMNDSNIYNNEEEGEEEVINEADFQKEVQKRKQSKSDDDENNNDSNEIENEFDGYALRDAIYTKYGKCYDVDFQPVQSFGLKELYLNILPFHLNGRRFRHETELDYLCHLQAVVEILIKYDQLEYVLYQLQETKKKPRAGTSPLVAVPLRLNLDEDQLNSILA